MAARINLKHDVATREKIQTSQLINRLNGHANGENEMSPTQVKAAEILLRKSLPDLSAVTLSGDADNPVDVRMSLARDEVRKKLARLADG